MGIVPELPSVASPAGLVSMAEVARMAAVRRPVVSNWRRRHADFPAPVSDLGGRPLFDGGQVVEWLLAGGRGNAETSELRVELVLFGITGLRERFTAWELVETLGSLLCLRHLDGRPLTPSTGGQPDDGAWAAVVERAQRMDAEDDLVLRELTAVGAKAAPLLSYAEALVEAAYGEHGAHEWLLASRRRLGAADLAADAVAPELQHLLVAVADVGGRLERHGEAVVGDPHARSGDLLAALLPEGEDHDGLTVLAADSDPRLVRLTRRRLLLAGVDELALDVQQGNELEERMADLDVVITQLPYRPGEERSAYEALLEVERVADLLLPGRTALVLGPADALVDELRDVEAAQLRVDLVRSGVVESVVALPGGLQPSRPGYRPALWTLTREPVDGARGSVLLVDVSAEDLTAGVAAHLAEDVLLWRAESARAPHGHDPRHGQVVSVTELYARFGAALTPTAPPASVLLSDRRAERPALIAEAEARLRTAADTSRALDATAGPYRGNVQRRMGHRPARITLRQLIRARRVRKLPGHRIDAADLSADGHHPVLSAEELTGALPVGSRRIDRLLLAARYDRAALTQPGDIVYTLIPRLALHVDHDGVSVVAYPARILRVRRDLRETLPPRALAALLGAARGTARSPGAVRAARAVEDYQLPDLDADELRRLDALLADVEEREALLRSQADALAEARRLTVAGLADGSLTVADGLRRAPP